MVGTTEYPSTYEWIPNCDIQTVEWYLAVTFTKKDIETPILCPPDAKDWLTGKDPDARNDGRQEKGMTEDEMAGWHHWLNGHEFE